MAVQSSSHWTDNEDVLERYVLGRIDAATRRGLEEHLATCEQCRRAVGRETELVAGVRRLGRDQLKARFVSRLAAAGGPRIPWPHVISAAAVLVIALGFAVHFFWMPIESWYTESTFQEITAETENHAAPSDEARRDKDVTGREGIVSRNERLLEKLDQTQGEDRKVREAPTPDDAAWVPEPSAEKEEEVFAVSGAASQMSVWVQGVIVPLAPVEQVDALEDAAQRALKKPQAQAREAQKGWRQEGDFTDRAVSAELRQQPLGALPESQQKLQRSRAQPSVETFMEQTPQGLRITLYLDQPIPDTELQRAIVQAVSEDSLIVVLSNQQIAYKIPSSLGTIQDIQLKTK
jgi:hypothetical protein